MALRTLLLAGAEAIAQGAMASLEWSIDSQGRDIRQRMTDRMRNRIRQSVESRLGRTLTSQERRELDQIIKDADQANRQARKLDQIGGRPPRPHQIPRLSGTGNRGGDTYTYTVVVSSVDSGSGDRRTFTVVLRSDRIESGAEIRARAMAMVSSGEIVSRQGTDPSTIGRVIVESVSIISVYRGSPDVA